MWVLNPMKDILIKEREEHRHRGEDHAKIEAETGVKVNEPHKTWSQRKLEEARDGSANTPMLDAYTLEL